MIARSASRVTDQDVVDMKARLSRRRCLAQMRRSATDGEAGGMGQDWLVDFAQPGNLDGRARGDSIHRREAPERRRSACSTPGNAASSRRGVWRKSPIDAGRPRRRISACRASVRGRSRSAPSRRCSRPSKARSPAGRRPPWKPRRANRGGSTQSISRRYAGFFVGINSSRPRHRAT